MKKIYLMLCALILILAWVACGFPGSEIQSQPPPEASENGGANGAINGGTNGGTSGVANGDTGGETGENTGGDTAVGIDYCDLPAGTRVTWFDLSTFIFIQQNSYQMGFDLPAGEFDFEPSHQVDLGAFWMHATEVTNRQYANCVAAGQCAPPEQYSDLPYWYEETDQLDDPVVGVTWEEADAYCTWIGTRLPTEAEWELTARGVNSEPYPWGTDAPDCEHANYLGCLDPDDPKPVIAGLLTKGISPFEMLDMAGNVNEWVHDWYAEDYYQNSPSANPTGPDTGEQRVWRGGGYNSTAEGVYSYLRDSLKPDAAEPDLGFRCVWTCGEDVPPQLCQLPPTVVEQPPLGENPPKPNFTGEGYCEWRRGVRSAGVVLHAPTGMDISQYAFSSPSGPITCNPAGDQIVCYGPGIQPDTNVPITVCPDCKPGYYFDLGQGLCMPLIQGDGDMEPIPIAGLCDDGYHHTEACGCILDGVICVEEMPGSIPKEDLPSTIVELFERLEEATADGDEDDERKLLEIDPKILDIFRIGPMNPVDPGHLEIDPNWDPTPETCQQGDLILRCMPGTFPTTDINGCRVCRALRKTVDCPQGHIYDTDTECCIPPVNRTCPRYTYFDLISNSCLPIQRQNACFDLSVYVPGCGPKPTLPPEQTVCTNPRLYYNDEAGCKSAGCFWYQPPTGGSAYCRLP